MDEGQGFDARLPDGEKMAPLYHELDISSVKRLASTRPDFVFAAFDMIFNDF